MKHRDGASSSAIRPVAMGRRGMVASANPLATLAGLRVLAAGGNAVDAAVATAVAITVVEPYFSSLGGGGGAVLSLPNGETRVLNFAGRVPHRLHPEQLTGKTRDIGPLASMVPGNVAGWARLHSEYGTLPVAQVLDPAIELARDGVPVTSFDHARTVQAMDRLLIHPEAAQTYLKDGHPYEVGELLRQPGLAGTLRTIAEEGWLTFYHGRIGQAIVSCLAEHGGGITAEDLRSYPQVPRWETPITARYRGYELRTLPPPTGAVQVLQTLRILEAFDLPNQEFLSPAYIALVAEAMRLARVDTAMHVADPLFVDVPLPWLLSDERIQELRADVTRRLEAQGREAFLPTSAASVTPRSGTAQMRRAKPVSERSTTHLAAADAAGMAVNITQSIGVAYGSGVVIDATGIVMNNFHRWCTQISARQDVLLKRPPGRTFSSSDTFGLHAVPLSPMHVFAVDASTVAYRRRENGLAFLIGTPGSYSIPQTTAQVIVNLVDFGLNIQDAISAPRFRWKDDVDDPLPPEVLLLEGRFKNPVRKALAAYGYPIEILEDWSIRVGGAQGIAFREDGWMMGGADPRRNGHAMGW